MHCQPIHNGKNHPHLNNGSSHPRLFPFFYSLKQTAVLQVSIRRYSWFFPAKIAFCLVAGKAALAGWLAGKNHPHSVPVFFPPSLALDKAKNRTGHVRNRNTALQGAGHVKFNPSRIMKRYQSWKGFPEYVPESGCAYTGREEQADRSIPPFGNNPVINATTL